MARHLTNEFSILKRLISNLERAKVNVYFQKDGCLPNLTEDRAISQMVFAEKMVNDQIEKMTKCKYN